jgi:hypothetical protein
MKWGYQGEKDLFVARACFEMLIRSENTESAKKVRSQFKEIASPIMNFVDILIEIIGVKDF